MCVYVCACACMYMCDQCVLEVCNVDAINIVLLFNEVSILKIYNFSLILHYRTSHCFYQFLQL